MSISATSRRSTGTTSSDEAPDRVRTPWRWVAGRHPVRPLRPRPDRFGALSRSRPAVLFRRSARNSPRPRSPSDAGGERVNAGKGDRLVRPVDIVAAKQDFQVTPPIKIGDREIVKAPPLHAALHDPDHDADPVRRRRAAVRSPEDRRRPLGQARRRRPTSRRRRTTPKSPSPAAISPPRDVAAVDGRIAARAGRGAGRRIRAQRSRPANGDSPWRRNSC